MTINVEILHGILIIPEINVKKYLFNRRLRLH